MEANDALTYRAIDLENYNLKNKARTLVARLETNNDSAHMSAEAKDLVVNLVFEILAENYEMHKMLKMIGDVHAGYYLRKEIDSLLNKERGNYV